MALRLITIAPAFLTTSAAAYYTCSTPTSYNSNKATIKKLTFYNSSSTYKLVTVYLVPSGGSAGDQNTLVYQRRLGAKETWDCTECRGHILQSGGSIQALCDSASAVNIIGALNELLS